MSRFLQKATSFLTTGLRVLFGLLLTFGGVIWLSRPAPGVYLSESIQLTLDHGGTIGFYEPFLRSVVLPNVGLFAFLVSWGEFLGGLSMLLGAASRLGTAVLAFQFLNYGLMGGATSVAIHSVLIVLILIPLYRRSGRRFGVDRWLYRRWPRALIW